MIFIKNLSSSTYHKNNYKPQRVLKAFFSIIFSLYLSTFIYTFYEFTKRIILLGHKKGGQNILLYLKRD